MELVAEDGGVVVFIPEGCKKEVGRGNRNGIVKKKKKATAEEGDDGEDRSVSKHHVLLQLEKLRSNQNLAENGKELLVKVQGENPVCIIPMRQNNCDNGMILLRKGEMLKLGPGDKISLSLVQPSFFTVRRVSSQGMVEANPRFKEKLLVDDDELHTKGGSDKEDRLNHDILRECRSQTREDETEYGQNSKFDRDWSILKHGEEARGSKRDQTGDDDEEEALARAIARRKKRGYERQEKQEEKSQPDLHTLRLRGAGELLALNDEFHDEPQESGYNPVTVENIDPVKEFGFLVEGSEFKQYKKKLDVRNMWISPIQKMSTREENEEDNSDDDDEEKNLWRQHTYSRKNKREQDDEWTGEDQDEKKVILNVKKSKWGTKQNLRSHELASSKKSVALADVDDDDKTLGGFIVDEDEDEEASDDEEEEEDEDEEEGEEEEEEEEEEDEDEEDEEDEENGEEDEEDEENGEEDEDEDEDIKQEDKKKKIKQKDQEKPLCKFGASCYRKNKEHLTHYQH